MTEGKEAIEREEKEKRDEEDINEDAKRTERSWLTLTLGWPADLGCAVGIDRPGRAAVSFGYLGNLLTSSIRSAYQTRHER